MPPAKQYDEAYYRRWYHNSGSRIISQQERARQIAMVLAASEYVLQHKVRTVLDVGCGEALWRAVLKRMRPSLRYTGVENSDYVVRKFGRSRGIVRGSFADLAALGKRSFDLVIVSDVLHYLSNSEVRQGAPALARLTSGVAYLNYFSEEDSVEGDRKEMRLRPAAWYRRLFNSWGLQPIGLQLWTSAARFVELSEAERG